MNDEDIAAGNDSATCEQRFRYKAFHGIPHNAGRPLVSPSDDIYDVAATNDLRPASGFEKILDNLLQ